MNIRHTYNVLSTAATFGFKQIFADKAVLLMSFAVYILIMVLFGGLMNMIPMDDIGPLGLTSAKMIWYMGTTELVLFTAVSWNFKDLQHSIKTEQIHLSLLRPFSSALVQVSMWCGESFARFCVYFPLYYVFITLFAGSFDQSAWHATGMMLSMPLGIFMLLCGNYFVGASCLWLAQSEIAFFIWQKMIFVLGAMFWPLIFYPDWVKPIIWATPFPAMLAASGNWTLSYGMWERTLIVGHQFVWGCLFFYLLLLYDRRVLRRIQKGEGQS